MTGRAAAARPAFKTLRSLVEADPPAGEVEGREPCGEPFRELPLFSLLEATPIAEGKVREGEALGEEFPFCEGERGRLKELPGLPRLGEEGEPTS